MTPETKIEKKVVKYARDYMIQALKLNVMGNRGWPDRVFFGPNAKILFIEFKQPGEEPRKLQQKIHRVLRRYGFNVSMVDDVEEGKKTIKEFFQI